MNDASEYWRFVRLSGSRDRADRLEAENGAGGAIEAFSRIEDRVMTPDTEALDVIVSVANLAVNNDELRYVCNELVEPFLDAGGSLDAVLLAATERNGPFARELRAWLTDLGEDSH